MTRNEIFVLRARLQNYRQNSTRKIRQLMCHLPPTQLIECPCTAIHAYIRTPCCVILRLWHSMIILQVYSILNLSVVLSSFHLGGINRETLLDYRAARFYFSFSFLAHRERWRWRKGKTGAYTYSFTFIPLMFQDPPPRVGFLRQSCLCYGWPRQQMWWRSDGD